MTNGWPAPASQNSVPMGRSDGLGTDEKAIQPKTEMI
jgi:hypothetical protein